MIGIVGSVAFAVSTLPEVYKAYKTRRCGLTWGLIILCAIGELCCLIEAIRASQTWLLWNYVPNSLFLMYLINIKIKENK
jgi:uncharacterized protein with PQ loop repeat